MHVLKGHLSDQCFAGALGGHLFTKKFGQKLSVYTAQQKIVFVAKDFLMHLVYFSGAEFKNDNCFVELI